MYHLVLTTLYETPVSENQVQVGNPVCQSHFAKAVAMCLRDETEKGGLYRMSMAEMFG